MRIKRIKITNFGRHKLVDERIDVSVVGLLGPNGSGKTTVLEAIEYAFTGELQQNQNSYMRHGSKKASVEVWFDKDGLDGYIRRSITKSGSTRELEWDGNVYKSSAEVSSVLDAILEVDKQALKNALFISQGDMSKLLKGDQSPREELYARMLLVSYLDKRGELLDKKAKALGAGITDLTALLDSARAARGDALEEYDEVERALKQAPDVREAAGAWSAARGAARDMVAANAAEKQARIDATAAAEAVRLAMDRYAKRFPEAGCGAEAMLSGTSASLKAASERLSRMQEARARHASVAELRTREASLREELEGLKGEAGRLAGFLSGRMASTEARKALDAATTILQARQQLDTCFKERGEVSAKLEELNGMPELVEPAGLAAGFDDEMAGLRLKVDLARAAKSRGVSVCWTCGGPLPEEAVDPGKLEAAARELEDMVAVKDGHDAAVRAYGREMAERAAKYAELSASLRRLDGMVLERMDTLNGMDDPGRTIGDLRDELDETLRSEARLEDLKPRIARLERELEEVCGKLASSSDPESVPSEGEVEKTKVEVRELAEVEGFLQPVVRDIERAETESGRAARAVESAKASVSAASGALQAAVDGLPPMLSGEGAMDDLYREDDPVGRMLAEKQEERARIEGRLHQAERSLSAAKAELARVEDRIAEDRRKVEVLRRLDRLKDVFSRTGLRLSYIQRRFEGLVPLVQVFLERMNADFAVEADPEVPVHFLFWRLDEESPEKMPQEKLSGGQSVRLALALLLALQRSVMPGIGFLVLDEPSMHLDQEGVESLRGVLEGLQEMLANSSAQIMLCDHNKVLESALEAVIKLGS